MRLTDGDRLVLDGRLTEEAWQRAMPASGFRQQDPNSGDPSTEPTAVRGLYDARSPRVAGSASCLVLAGAGGGNGQAAGVNRSWDGIWEAHVSRDERGWSAEIAIPFNTINFKPDASSWGIHFQRTIPRKVERTLWT